MDERLKDKVLPHNIEAEQALLGALLTNWNDTISETVATLSPDRFYSIQNQTIYSALSILYQKNIKGDLISLTNELTAEGNIEKAGGEGYIASLPDMVPSAANIDYYKKVISDCYTRRELIKISSEVKASAFELNTESSVILDAAEQKIFSLAEKNETATVYDAKKVMEDDIKIIMRRIKNKDEFMGVPSGFADLDAMTNGFQNSELIIIGARPSIGKTALALSMMHHIALERKIRCGFFSLEMPYEQIGMRLLTMDAHVNMSKIRSGMLNSEDLDRITAAANRWYESPLYTVDTPNMRLLELRAMARRLVVNNKVQIIFIDYIGLITTENTAAPVYEQVSEISKSLKALARELEIPIVALCQVGRDAEGKEPNLAQLRGSGSVEQDADVVMFIDRDRKNEQNGKAAAIQDAKIILAKQRNGPTGDINIAFVPSYSMFANKKHE